MKKHIQFSFFTLVIIFLFLPAKSILSQVETIPVDNRVYSLLKYLQVKGVITDYSDYILPLSRQHVLQYLQQADTSQKSLNRTEKLLIIRMIEEFSFEETQQVLFDFPDLFTYNKKYLYRYSDEKIKFYINPILELNNIYSFNEKRNAFYLNAGGRSWGSYNYWLGFSVLASNAIIWGDREAAVYDQKIKQSFTFNDTKINYADYTEGYLRFHNELLSFQLGRERVLWGTGYINKNILSTNPPIFDFIKLDIHYKSLSYNFIHGWLSQKPFYIQIDSINGARIKNDKYLAISRLGFMPSSNVEVGVSQIIIYANRSFEAAYLNPFLFWESAQRSINDLDNSFLNFDFRYLIANGMELSGSMLIDDINLERLSKGEWSTSSNGNLWQLSLYLSSPFYFMNSNLKIEYGQIRPYTFSHHGIRGSLSYTHNDYLLGLPYQPNSIYLNTESTTYINSRIKLDIGANYTIHGNNYYDSDGNLLINFGGNVFDNYTYYDNQFAYLLKGDLTKKLTLYTRFNYEIFYGFFFNTLFEYQISGESLGNKNTIISSSLLFNF